MKALIQNGKKFEIDLKDVDTFLLKDMSDFISKNSLTYTFQIFDSPVDILDKNVTVAIFIASG